MNPECGLCHHRHPRLTRNETCPRADVRAAGLLLQVAAAEVAWELGRDHPLFDRLMLAVTRHQTALDELAQ